MVASNKGNHYITRRLLDYKLYHSWHLYFGTTDTRRISATTSIINMIDHPPIITFLSQNPTVVLLLVVFIVSLLLDVLYEVILDGRTPRLIPRIIFITLLQAATIFIGIDINKVIRGEKVDIVFNALLLLAQVLFLFIVAALVQNAKRITNGQIKEVLKDVPFTRDQTTLVQDLQTALVQEDLTPNFWLTKVFSDDNKNKRILFLDVVKEISKDAHALNEKELLIKPKERFPLKLTYITIGVLAFISLLFVIYLSVVI